MAPEAVDDAAGAGETVRARRVLVTSAVLLLLAGGCAAAGQAEPGGGTASAAAAGSAPAAAATTPSTQVSGTPVDPAAFLDRVMAASRAMTSVQGTITVSAGDRQVADGTYAGQAADGRVLAATAELTISMRDQHITLTMTIVDQRLYVHSDALEKELGYGKPWLEITKDATDQRIRQLAANLDGVLGAMGPNQFEQARSAVIAVGEVGPADRDGVTLQHFQVLIDARKAAEITGQQLPAQAPDTVLVDLWLDDQDRPVETSTQVSVQDQQITTRNQVTAFDEPVTITAPDPADVGTG